MSREKIIFKLESAQEDILADKTLSGKLKEELSIELDKIINCLEATEKKADKMDQTVFKATRNTIMIWSDGACSGNPGPGGWGTIVEIDGVKHEFSGGSKQTTNNIMEMTGALEGIKRTPEGSKVIVTTDSNYLVKGITGWIFGWKKKGWKTASGEPVKNKALWQKIDSEASKRNIEWKWVKGHAGHIENERCDSLARQAIDYL